MANIQQPTNTERVVMYIATSGKLLLTGDAAFEIEIWLQLWAEI